MAKPAVILVGADKGGVGKTTVSRALLDYLIAHNIPTRAFDTEFPKGTLRRFHPDITEVVDLTSTADQMKVFDSVSTASARSPSSTCARDFCRPRSRRCATSASSTLPRRACSPSACSTSLGRRSPRSTRSPRRLDTMGELSYFLVKNFINNTTFFEWDPATYNGLFQEDQRRPGDHRSETLRDGLRTGRARRRSRSCVVANKGIDTQSANYSFVLRGYVRHWLGNVWAEFDRVKLNDIVGADASRKNQARQERAG